jgi:hypothetical protein
MTVQRWNDEMLDDLASSVTELRESITEVRIALPHPKSELLAAALRYRPPLSPKSEQLKCNFIFSSNSNQKS